MYPDNLSDSMDSGIRSSRTNNPSVNRTKRPRRIFQHSLNGGNINLILKAMKVGAIIDDNAIDMHKEVHNGCLTENPSSTDCRYSLEQRYSESTNSKITILAASPWRGPILIIRVYPPLRSA